MSADLTSYEVVDYEAATAAIRSATALQASALKGSVSAGWVGFVEDGQPWAQGGEPQPSNDPLHSPTMFCRYQMVHDSNPDVSLDNSSVVRQGTLRFALRYQPGTTQGTRRLFWQTLRAALLAASDGSALVYFVESPVTPQAPQVPWFTEELPMRFMGVS